MCLCASHVESVNDFYLYLTSLRYSKVGSSSQKRYLNHCKQWRRFVDLRPIQRWASRTHHSSHNAKHVEGSPIPPGYPRMQSQDRLHPAQNRPSSTTPVNHNLSVWNFNWLWCKFLSGDGSLSNDVSDAAMKAAINFARVSYKQTAKITGKGSMEVVIQRCQSGELLCVHVASKQVFLEARMWIILCFSD